jgi:hypothetical protein
MDPRTPAALAKLKTDLTLALKEYDVLHRLRCREERYTREPEVIRVLDGLEMAALSRYNALVHSWVDAGGSPEPDKRPVDGS